MDVVLVTNAPEKLVLSSIRRFNDESGFVCRLGVDSRGFSVARNFYFDRAGLETFLAGLSEMDRVLSGRAELRTPYEDDRITFEALRTGAIVVAGEIHDHSEFAQHLAFSFRTDQTCLKPFLRQLAEVLSMPAA